MGSDVLIRIRKYVVICTRVSCRSVRGHPFLIGFLCWLYCFYRYFPVLFSLVVSASPVLITTALLLGTLLSYGDSNLPEFEEEEEEVSERNRSGSEGIVADRDVGKVRARVFGNVDSDDEGKKEDDSEDDSEDEFGDDEDDDNKPLIIGTSKKRVFEKWVGDEVERDVARSLEIDDEKVVSRELGEGSGSRHLGEGGLHDGMSNVEYERLEAEDRHSLSGAVDDPFALNTVYTSFRLSPKREVADDHQGNDSQNENDHGSETESDENDEEEDEDDSSDSESDANESSSPDASMTDIMPLLDELHPLLDEDVPQQAQGATSSIAQRSVDASSIESGEDSENQEEDDGEDDNEEDAHSNKGEGDKPEITWTEDDQKNLMDMGTSELERNQRLENLIARRRLRKSMRLSDEKNLIDLESTDLPFNVPHISTLRRNPFDSPVDSYDAMGLPPIPGSAPSILHPRRNPFDLPYDQNEEKPILTGDNFAQEFIPPQRDAHFRRYESFSVGPVNGGTSRQDMRRRPYFVPERTAAEEAYASIQRQLSEVSESKASSVPETDSVSSASDDEDQKITEPDTLTETNMVSKDEHDSNHSEYESQSSEDAESVTDEPANMNVNQNEFEIQLGGGSETLQETETHTASIEESSSSYVESGHSEINMSLHAVDENSDVSSHSSPTAEMQGEHDEISMELGYVHDDFPQAGTDFSGSVETARSEMHLPIEQVDDGSDSSSVTSLSEANEEVSDTVGRREIFEETGDIMEDESHSLVHSLVGESSVNLKLEIPDDHHIQEPVYDSSPTPVERVLLFSSASVDRQPESSEVGETSHLSVDDENKEDKEPSYKDGNTPHDHVELRYEEIQADVGQTSSSTLSHQSISTDATLLAAGDDHPHLEAEHVSEEDDGSSSSDTDSSEENSVDRIEEKDVPQVEHVEVQSSIQIDSEAVVVQDSIVGPDASSDSDSLEDQFDTTTIEVHEDELPIPSSDDDAINQEQVLAGTINQQADSDGPSSSDADQNQLHETPTTNSSFNTSQEITDSSSTVEAESVKKTSTDEAASRVIPEVSVAIPLKNRLIESIKGMSAGGAPSDKQDEFQTPVSARYFDFTSEGFQPNATGIDEDEMEDFKELDEGMLAELDTIGDFSVPNIEASTVDDAGMTFHHIDDEVPVEEVILPSLLFGGRAAVLPENEDSKDVPISEPNSPFSDTKEVSLETEELIASTTDGVVKTETVPTSSVSSPNTDALEKTETEPTRSVSSPNTDALEKTETEPLSSNPSSPKTETVPASSVSSPNTDALEKTEIEPTSSVSSPNTDTLEKTETEPLSSSPSSPKTESQKEGLDTRDLEHNEDPKLLPEETPVKSTSKKEKSHDSSSSSSSSDSDSD